MDRTPLKILLKITDLTFCTFDKRFDLVHETKITFDDIDTLDDYEITDSPSQQE